MIPTSDHAFIKCDVQAKGDSVSETVIRAVCFDMDGLMFNTEDIFNRSGRELLRRRGFEMTDEILSKMMGRRAHEAFTALIDHLKLPETVEQLRIESDEIFHGMLYKMVDVMPGLHQLLELIESRAIPKAVATSSGRSYLEGLLAHFNLADRFVTTLTSEDVTQGKPHPEIYLTAADRLGVAPEEMLVLEDSGHGTTSAAAAGTHIVSIPHQHSRSQDFSNAKHVAESLTDPYIVGLIESQKPTTP